MGASSEKEQIKILQSYSGADDQNTLKIIEIIRNRIFFNYFKKLVKDLAFSEKDWSNFLHLSERTLQRYKKEKRAFDPLYSEKIIEIIILYNKGVEVFGDKAYFDSWLTTENIALGGIRPKDLLDTSFGISMVKDQLIRIEHGTLA